MADSTTDRAKQPSESIALTYDVVLADPPWSYYGDPNKMAAAGKHYDLMPDDDLLAFPMRKWLSSPGVLFMWATSPRLDFAVRCIEEWGLHYRGVAFVWVKTRQDGAIIGAQGVRPSIVKPTCEFVLAASTKQFGRPLPLAAENVAQTILAPRRGHSSKPDEVQERIEALYPANTKVELFARRRRNGWDAWGNQLPSPEMVVQEARRD